MYKKLIFLSALILSTNFASPWSLSEWLNPKPSTKAYRQTRQLDQLTVTNVGWGIVAGLKGAQFLIEKYKNPKAISALAQKISLDATVNAAYDNLMSIKNWAEQPDNNKIKLSSKDGKDFVMAILWRWWAPFRSYVSDMSHCYPEFLIGGAVMSLLAAYQCFKWARHYKERAIELEKEGN